MPNLKKKSLKYKDLPWELKGQINFTYGHIQKAQNPTVRHILEKLKKHEKEYIETGAEVTAQENRDTIDKLEGYIKTAEV